MFLQKYKFSWCFSKPDKLDNSVAEEEERDLAESYKFKLWLEMKTSPTVETFLVWVVI